MEEPIRFDVWGQANPQERELVLERFQRKSPEASRSELLRWWTNARQAGQVVMVSERVSWTDALALRHELGIPFNRIRIYQSGYGPSDEAKMNFCEQHAIHYGGVVGCPVCYGRNAK